MAENKAVEKPKYDYDELGQARLSIDKAYDVMLNTLQEVRKYRSLGSIEEIAGKIQLLEVKEKELNAYREIGTVEECREAREWQLTKVNDAPTAKGHSAYDERKMNIEDEWDLER